MRNNVKLFIRGLVLGLVLSVATASTPVYADDDVYNEVVQTGLQVVVVILLARTIWSLIQPKKRRR